MEVEKETWQLGMKPEQFCLFCFTWREVIKTYIEIVGLWITYFIVIFIFFYYRKVTGLTLSPIYGYEIDSLD